MIGAAVCEEASKHAIQRQRDSAQRTRSLYVMFDYARFKAVHLFRNREAQEVRQKLAVTGNLVMVEGNSEAVSWGVDGWGNRRNKGDLPEVEREFAVYPEREFSHAIHTCIAHTCNTHAYILFDQLAYCLINLSAP
jgi:hypothetical protein